MWLRAQATNLSAEAKFLAQQESVVKFVGDIGSGGRGHSRARGRRGMVLRRQNRTNKRTNGRVFQSVTRRWSG